MTLFNAATIRKLFEALNDELAAMNIIGEVVLCGGAVMCLVYQTREATKDIDAVFAPSRELRLAGQKVAKRFGISADWLNDAAKGFFYKDPPKEDVLDLSHLRVYAPRADYMLAMKSVSARFDSHDRTDLAFLIDYLGLKTPAEVFEIISNYYPRNQIPAKTQFLLEELFENKHR